MYSNKNGSILQEENSSDDDIINRLVETSHPEKKVEFSEEMVWRMVGILLTDVPTLEKFRPQLSPNQMQTQAQADLVEIAYAYYDKYQTVPTAAVVREEIVRRYPKKENGGDHPQAILVQGAYNTATDYYIPALDERSYLHDRLQDWCERTALAKRMRRIAEHWQTMPLAEFKEEVAKLSAGSKDEKNYSFTPLSSEVFKATDYRMTWAIEGLLVRDQPFILAGPKKSLKTSLLVDLVLSLGSATPFLGKFRVPKPIKTAFISGESGEYTIKETALRVCAAKKIDLAETLCGWDFRLPRLSVATDLLALVKGLRDQGYEIIVIDPLYLCLLSGAKDKQASNMFDMGPIFSDAVSACKRGGAQVGLAHHTVKHLGGGYEPMQLEDMAFAGCAEFARQWLLVNRRESYEPGSGLHRLWLQSGGSVGHGSLLGLDIDEGKLQHDFSGRTWNVSVKNLEDLKNDKLLAKDDKDIEAQNEFLTKLDALESPPAPSAFCREHLGWGREKFNRISQQLQLKNIIVEVADKVAIGNKAKRDGKVIKRN